MVDRRILLASTAGLLGFAALRWLRGEPANAAEKFEVEKTDAEWRAQLTPQQYEILRNEAPNARSPARCSMSTAKAPSPAPAATCRCSRRKPNTKAAPDGRASISRWTMRWANGKTAPSACCAAKSIAAAAAAISATCSMTVQSRPACATAWTVLRCNSIRQRQRRASPTLAYAELCPGNCCPPGNCAPVLRPGLFCLST